MLDDYFKIEDKISDCRWADVCYADDELEGHKLDIYLPDTGKSSHKVVVLIYGSAWFANNMKQFGYNALGKPLLDAGFAVIAINHRSSSDAAYPAQINDVKAAQLELSNIYLNGEFIERNTDKASYWQEQYEDTSANFANKIYGI